jgi:hypothetical protein
MYLASSSKLIIPRLGVYLGPKIPSSRGKKPRKGFWIGDNLLEPSFRFTNELRRCGPVLCTRLHGHAPAQRGRRILPAGAVLGAVGVLAAFAAWSMSSDIIVDRGRCVGLACIKAIPFAESFGNLYCDA